MRHGSAIPPFVIPSEHWPGAPTQSDEKHLFFSDRSSWKRSPSPLSSRAKPRDLQFCRLALEMFCEEAVWASRPVGPTAKRQPSPEGLGIKLVQTGHMVDRIDRAQG